RSTRRPVTGTRTTSTRCASHRPSTEEPSSSGSTPSSACARAPRTTRPATSSRRIARPSATARATTRSRRRRSHRPSRSPCTAISPERRSVVSSTASPQSVAEQQRTAPVLVAGHQPHYLPWIGYFNKIEQSSRFCLVDSVQFVKKWFQNRNKIRTKTGDVWLTVPVKTHDRFEQPI